jgi:hypothetical protein
VTVLDINSELFALLLDFVQDGWDGGWVAADIEQLCDLVKLEPYLLRRRDEDWQEPRGWTTAFSDKFIVYLVPDLCIVILSDCMQYQKRRLMQRVIPG